MINRELWVRGEKGARDYLEKKGYKILAANYKTKVGEIDLIAADKGTLVFVEVKARTSDAFGQPIEAVTPYKVRKIVLVAKQFMLQKRVGDVPVRFDVIEILGDRLRHTENAFTLNDAAIYFKY